MPSDSCESAATKANPAALTNALAEGWAPTQQHCGGEASEILQAMSWMGRKSAEKLVQHLKANLDRVLIESRNCFLKKLVETLQKYHQRLDFAGSKRNKLPENHRLIQYTNINPVQKITSQTVVLTNLEIP